MPRPSITPEERVKMRGHVREALVRIARQRELTAADTAGWNSITIRDVIEEAGISIGTFYRYFKDRSDLAQTLWVEPVNLLRAAMEADFNASASTEKKLRSLLKNYANFALENRQLFRSVFLFVRPPNNAPPEQLELREEPFYAMLRAAFEQGQMKGVFREFDTHIMAQTFWAAIHGSLALSENFDRYCFDDAKARSSAMIDSLIPIVLR